jgi:uncharacterized protein (DUF58 family)
VRRSPKLVPYAAFAGACLVAALVVGRPELVALGAPFVLMLVLSVVLPSPLPARAAVHLARDRVLEGEDVEATLVIYGPRCAPLARVALSLPEGVEGDKRSSIVLRPPADDDQSFPIRLRCARWGAYRVGDLSLRSGDLLGLRYCDSRVEGDAVLRVYPQAERLLGLIDPLATQPFSGNRVAKARGEGIEFADLRAYAPGDRLRRINWSASSKRGSLFVNTQQPERNADIVLFVDHFAEARRGDEGTLDVTVRAATSLAQHYLATHDRVGLVSFGAWVRWLTPAPGKLQAYRIADALLQTQVTMSFAWKDIDVLPARSLTPQALVVALTPLLDPRTIDALLDLRRRGFDLVVIDVSPLRFVLEELTPDASLSLRLWRVWRETMRLRYESVGVAMVEWEVGRSLASVVEEVQALRRSARYRSV